MAELPSKIGRYQVLAELGRGGMGVVYKAVDPNIDRTVALKVIRLGFHADEELFRDMQERFKREAKAAGVLNHPNIVTVYDAGDDEGTSFIAMEFVEGTPLDELVRPGEQMAAEQANSIIRQVALGLACAHEKGIVHRDIKPANIIVTEDGQAKLMDFGIARLSNSELTQAGTIIGSPSYMSPEQLTGSDVDHRTDIFSLGVVFYQLLTGERPFAGDNPTSIAYKIVRTDPGPVSAVNPAVPRGYDKILAKAMAKPAQDRYASAADMALELARLSGEVSLIGGMAFPGLADPVYKRVFKRVIRSPWTRVAGVALGAFLVLAAVTLVSYRVSNPLNEVNSLIADGRHGLAVRELLKMRVTRPGDPRVLHLLGSEYQELEDYRSSLQVFGELLARSPGVARDPEFLGDLIASLGTPEAVWAQSILVEQIGDGSKDALRSALETSDSNIRWRAFESLEALGEEVDEMPLWEKDLKYNADCDARRRAVDRMAELAKPSALGALGEARGNQSMTDQCPGLSRAIDQAMEKINGVNP